MLTNPPPSLQFHRCDPGGNADSPTDSVSYLPMAAYLELTPACNNRCPGCTNEEFVVNFGTRSLKPQFQRPILSFDQWEQIFDSLAVSVRSIILTGGEATLHPNFTTIAESLDRRNIDFVLFTNARWHAPQELISLLRSLPYCRGVLISLHGASASTHEIFTGVPGSFDETVTNIIHATEAGLAVNISTVITHQNVDELTEIVHLSQKLEAKALIFNRYLLSVNRGKQPLGTGILDDTAPLPHELRRAVATIEQLRTQFINSPAIGYGPCIPQCFTPSSSIGCTAGTEFLVVDPWGNVKPCTDAPLYCGNLLTHTLQEVWMSQAMQRWRRMTPEGCSTCSALSQCRTGCRAMALKSVTGKDPLMGIPLVTHL